MDKETWLKFGPGEQEDGYERVDKPRDKAVLRGLIGKDIVFVRHRDVDVHRGRGFPRFIRVHSVYYSYLRSADSMGNISDEYDIRDIIEMGVKK